MQESRRIVKQPPAISYFSRMDELSGQMGEIAESADNPSCGVISVGVFSHHIEKGYVQTLNYLTQFRQYVEFHIRMIRLLLHSRLRKRVNRF